MKVTALTLTGLALPVGAILLWTWTHYRFGNVLYRELYWPVIMALALSGAAIVCSTLEGWRTTLLVFIVWVPVMVAIMLTATLIVGCRYDACL